MLHDTWILELSRCLSGCWWNSCIGACPSLPSNTEESLRILVQSLLCMTLWVDLLSSGVGTPVGQRTLQTIGEDWGRQGCVEQRSPCNRKWRGPVFCPNPSAPGWHTLTHLDGSPQHKNRDSWKSKDTADKRAILGAIMQFL